MALFARQIENKKLVATGELLRSFHADVLRGAGTIEAQIKYNFYGKFRDMKAVGFKKIPPSQVIEDWINDVGPGSFKLPVAPTVSQAVKKLVWMILRSISKSHKIENKKGAWKSSPEYYRLVGKYRSKIAREAGTLVAHYVSVTIGDERTDI
jgi:hypothetical protein